MSRKFALAAAIAAAVTLASFDGQAMPLSNPLSGADLSGVTLVAGGCGPGWHRGPAGRCRRNVVVAPVVVAPAPVVVAPRVCPPRFRLNRRGVCVRI